MKPPIRVLAGAEPLASFAADGYNRAKRMSSLRNALLILGTACAVAFAAVPRSPAQTPTPTPSSPTANFIFNDQNGAPDAGTYPAGASFTFSANVSFTPGGNLTNLEGISYWFEQQSPVAPFYFSITNRDITGSQFTFLQSPGLTYPQSLAPSNANDLGGLTDDGNGFGAGTYFVANITISIDKTAVPGTYIIENTTTGGKTSVVIDSRGHTFGVAHTSYTITVVPFNIASIVRDDNQDIILQGNAVPNAVNRIEASPDLSPNSFQTIGSVTPDSTGGFSFKDTNPPSPQFYRLSYP